MDQLYSLQFTSYGGRGLFATTTLPEGTLLLNSQTPFAFTIYRQFRKEVCHYCFAYAFDCGRNSWSVRYEAQAGLGGFYFCTEACRERWDRELNIDGLLGMMYAAIDKATKTMKRRKGPLVEPCPLATLTKEEVTPELLELAWNQAEKLYSQSGTQIPTLDEYELDVARFIASALVRRYSEEKSSPAGGSQPDPVLTGHPRHDTRWEAFLELQNNELPHTRSRPSILDRHIRVYGFLRKISIPALKCYLETSNTVRSVLGKDAGNAFGLWETSTEGDQEMFGWGSYISASYFNHGCSPNVRKERKGRNMVFYTAREIQQGEELCISYVDVDDTGLQRRVDLFDNWYFDCGCGRCQEGL